MQYARDRVCSEFVHDDASFLPPNFPLFDYEESCLACMVVLFISKERKLIATQVVVEANLTEVLPPW